MTNLRAEADILRALVLATEEAGAARLLARLADELERALTTNASASLAWKTVPLEVYESLPPGIASSWVFALRADCTSGAERHPNSIQRFMSYRGSADMQLWNGQRWTSNVLTSDASAPLERRCLSIPKNVWHKPVMGTGNWVVVSFHTASDAELIEERPADEANPDAGPTRSELYEGRAAR